LQRSNAPGGAFRHWAAYDISAGNHGAWRGEGRETQEKFKPSSDPATAALALPRAHGAHRYGFRLLALSIDRLPVGKGGRCRDVERQAQKHMLAETELVGTFER